MRPTIPLFGLCALTLLGGCSEAPAHLIFDRTDLQLGTVNDDAGVSAVLTVINHGQAESASIQTSIIGDNEITIASDGCRGQTLGHDERCTITVNLRSQFAGSFSASLNVGYLGGINSFPVRGTVSEAKLVLTPDSDHLDAAIAQPDSMLVSVRNTGGARSGAIHLELDNGTFTNNLCEGHTVAGGGVCYATLTFTGAAAVGTLRATLVATGTPGGQVSQLLSLNTVPLQIDGVTGVLLPAPDVLERTIKVHNVGVDPVLWNSLDLEMSNSLAAGSCLVSHDPCTSTKLAVDGSCSVTVRCLSAPAQWQDGAITLRSPDGVIVGKSKIHVYGAQSRINVSYAGTGHGKVRVLDVAFAPNTSTDGVSAGSQQVTGSYDLYAEADIGSFIASWGNCVPSAASPNVCTVTIDDNRDPHVTAVFNLQ